MKYLIPLKYFFVMTVLLVFTGLWMSILHTSLSIEGTLVYYAPKSAFGLLETVSPHIFGMVLLVFIMTHFFAIAKELKQEKYYRVSILFYFILLFTNLSGFFISETGYLFAVVKLFSTLLFVLFILISIVKVLKVLYFNNGN